MNANTDASPEISSDASSTSLKPAHQRRWLVPLAQALLSALILCLVTNWHKIYEEDQMAKTAQIVSLATNGNWKHFDHTTNYYLKDLFSAYYFAATGFYKLTGLPARESLTIFSMVCGVIFFTVMPVFLRRVFELPPWLSWAALMSAPILIISFNYGNEAAFAVTMAALAAFSLTYDSVTACVIAAFCYAVSTYSRSDYLLLWPALSCLTLRRAGKAMDWRATLRRWVPFTVASAIFGVSYLVLVLHKLPLADFYPYEPVGKIFAAFMVYSPNVINVVFAIIGFAICVAGRRKKFLLLLVVLIQFIPYITRLLSPKYILPTVVVIVAFAVVGLLPLWRRARWLPILILALPWFVSISPFGVFGPARSAYWYVPSDDGPLPAGGYLGFYQRVKQGFYQARYDQEVEQVSEAMPLIENQPQPTYLAGYFNIQAVCLWAAQNSRWDVPSTDMPFWVNALDDHGELAPKLMIKMSYLYGFHQSPKLQEQLEASCHDGRVKARTDATADPLPDVIQCGMSLPVNSDHELGQRILFMTDYFRENQVMRRIFLVKEFNGVCWIPRSRFAKEGLPAASLLYSDSSWACVNQSVDGGIYYSMRYPMKYSRDHKLF
jgi:hypothetical protein